MKKTKQETFDFIVSNLRAQGGPSIRVEPYDDGDGSGGNEQCAYRDPNGAKCAAGWCIPDDKYKPMWEGCSLQDELGMAPKVREVIEKAGWDLRTVIQMQAAHDLTAFKSNWEVSFLSYAKRVAEELGLDPKAAL